MSFRSFLYENAPSAVGGVFDGEQTLYFSDGTSEKLGSYANSIIPKKVAELTLGMRLHEKNCLSQTDIDKLSVGDVVLLQNPYAKNAARRKIREERIERIIQPGFEFIVESSNISIEIVPDVHHGQNGLMGADAKAIAKESRILKKKLNL